MSENRTRVMAESKLADMLKCVSLLLLSFALSLYSLSAYQRFHPDEAFYMTFARNAAVNGDWWLSGALDKPPLTHYLNAVALIFFAIDTDVNGVLHLDVYKGEFSARITGVFVGLVCGAVLIQLAYMLYRRRDIALLAGLLFALSPYMLAFAPTAFTDMPMMLGSLFSLLFAARKRPFWSGTAFILAFAAKPQAVFFAPLILAFQQISRSASQLSADSPKFQVRTQYVVSLPKIRRSCFTFPITPESPVHRSLNFLLFPFHLNLSTQFSASRTRYFFRNILIWFLPVLMGGFALWLWDTLRPETSVFLLGAINNGHEALFAALGEMPTRINTFLRDGQWLLGSAVTTGIIIFILCAGIIVTKNTLKRMVALWLIGYVLLHLVTTLNLYDRYWLLLLPGLVLLAADSLTAISSQQSAPKSLVPKAVYFLLPAFRFDLFTYRASPVTKPSALKKTMLIVLILMVFYAAIFVPIPIGSDRGQFTGMDELAEYLNTKPVATVIYDRWLGWELGYYLGQWTNKRRVHFPTPEALAQGALALDEIGTRYLVAPAWENIDDWITELQNGGFEVTLEKKIANFEVYAVLPPSGK